jgi:hypothetical protein
MTSLSPSLASIRDELAGTTARLHALVDHMDDASWRTRPGAGRWSVAECVQHLNLTSHSYLPVLRAALDDARARGLTNPEGNNRVGLVGRLILNKSEPPVKRQGRVRTSAPFVPGATEPRAHVVREYEALQHQLIALLSDAEGLAVSKIKISSPFFSKLRYSVYFAFRMIPSHQRRHLWQAEEAREALRAVAR